MEKLLTKKNCVKHRKFTTESGATEHFMIIQSDETSVTEALTELDFLYTNKRKELGLKEKSLVNARIYVSDIRNQYSLLIKSPLYKYLKTGAISVVEQTPLEYGKLALIVYHITAKNSLKKTSLSKKNSYHSSFQLSNYSIVSTVIQRPKEISVQQQTTDVFEHYKTLLKKDQLSLLNNVVRTWIYVHDVDRNYGDMVNARKVFFEKEGLTEKTRYIASTGIEAKLVDNTTLISMDALALAPLQPQQIIRLSADDKMCPTIHYGITFERGTKIQLGDRAHFYISGTASINKKGNVLHIGNIQKQAKRTLENINALLMPHGASLEDMMYYIIYVRDRKDTAVVQTILSKYIDKKTPCLYVEGAVCRPTWLIEIEGVAIISNNSPFPVFA